VDFSSGLDLWIVLVIVMVSGQGVVVGYSGALELGV
jgi:hypothetical protein